MEKLIIIGNGFDIFHGLPTKYSDFKNFIKLKKPKLYYLLENLYDAPDLWSEFELNLSSLNLQSLINDCANGVGDRNDEHPMRSEAYIEDNCDYCIDKLIYGIKDSLCEWILNIDYNIINSIKFSCFSNENSFISFNYSKTLENIYGIKEESIVYIHNKAENYLGRHDDHNHSNIIIGHNVKENYNCQYVPQKEFNLKNIFCEEAFEKSKRYYKEMFKNAKSNFHKLDRVIESIHNYNKIYILGHSLSDVDIDYFMYITSQCSNKIKYCITHYNSLEKIETQSRKFLQPDADVEFVNLSENNILCEK